MSRDGPVKPEIGRPSIGHLCSAKGNGQGKCASGRRIRWWQLCMACPGARPTTCNTFNGHVNPMFPRTELVASRLGRNQMAYVRRPAVLVGGRMSALASRHIAGSCKGELANQCAMGLAGGHHRREEHGRPASFGHRSRDPHAAEPQPSARPGIKTETKVGKASTWKSVIAPHEGFGDREDYAIPSKRHEFECSRPRPPSGI